MPDDDLKGLETRLQALLAEYRRLTDENRELERALTRIRKDNGDLQRRLRSVLERIRALEVETT